MIRHQEGRSVRVWEVMVLNGVMLPEIVEDLLESLCKSDAGGEGLNMLGRVLVELVTLPASNLKNHLPYRPRSGRVVLALDRANSGGEGILSSINSRMPRYP